MRTALLVIAASAERQVIHDKLTESHSVDLVNEGEVTDKDLFSKRYDLFLVDADLLDSHMKACLPEKSAKDFFKNLKGLFPSAYFVVLSDSTSHRRAFEAVKAGADNYLIYPTDSQEVALIVQLSEEAALKEQELQYLRNENWQDASSEIARTNSSLMKGVYKKISSVAPTRTTVLLTGESGTGKTLAAKLIHRLSTRATKQFISVHCGAIPETLVESELFGHEKGAFTGADRKRVGKFEIAHEGTLFLDEIGTISSAVQIKLLQVLQERHFQRVGGQQDISTDVRIITATNSNLEELCEAGDFRKDLFYRLNVFPIELPPLRERIEDIPILANGFLDNLNGIYDKGIKEIDPLVLEAFRNYHWPGNIRELENLLERAYIIEVSDSLTSDSFPTELFCRTEVATPIPVKVNQSLSEVRKEAVERVENHYLREVLTVNGGKIAPSAAQAGITTRQLHKLMTKYGIRKEEFR